LQAAIDPQTLGKWRATGFVGNGISEYRLTVEGCQLLLLLLFIMYIVHKVQNIRNRMETERCSKLNW